MTRLSELLYFDQLCFHNYFLLSDLFYVNLQRLNKCVSKNSGKTVASSPYHYTRNPIDDAYPFHGGVCMLPV